MVFPISDLATSEPLGRQPGTMDMPEAIRSERTSGGRERARDDTSGAHKNWHAKNNPDRVEVMPCPGNGVLNSERTDSIGLSALGKIWRFANSSDLSQEFLSEVGGSNVLAQILAKRGIDSCVGGKVLSRCCAISVHSGNGFTRYLAGNGSNQQGN